MTTDPLTADECDAVADRMARRDDMAEVVVRVRDSIQLNRTLAAILRRLSRLEREQGTAGGERAHEWVGMATAPGYAVEPGQPGFRVRRVSDGVITSLCHESPAAANRASWDDKRRDVAAARERPTPPADKAGPAPGYTVSFRAPRHTGVLNWRALLGPEGEPAWCEWFASEAAATAATWEHAKAAAAEATHAQQPAPVEGDSVTCDGCGDQCTAYAYRSFEGAERLCICCVNDVVIARTKERDEALAQRDTIAADFARWKVEVGTLPTPLATRTRAAALTVVSLAKGRRGTTPLPTAVEQLMVAVDLLASALHETATQPDAQPPQQAAQQPATSGRGEAPCRHCNGPNSEHHEPFTGGGLGYCTLHGTQQYEPATPPRTRSALTVAADAVQERKHAISGLAMQCDDESPNNEAFWRRLAEQLQKVEDELREAAKGGE